MPHSIPKGLTREHILKALADLDAGIEHPFGDPTQFQLVDRGKRYAPKAVIGIAFRHLTGEILHHSKFSGGEAPGQANYELRRLGFEVESKVEEPVNLLVIVPCGQKKVWDMTPNAGATPAKHAYTGAPFTVNRAFAEQFGGAWRILSAKYGFILPEFEILHSYNVTFKRKATGPVSTDQLRDQVRVQGLHQFKEVIGLGGKEYRQAIRAAFQDTPVKLHFPFAGLAIGKAMQATKKAIAANDPHVEPKMSKMTPQAGPDPTNVAEICNTLHQWLNALPVHQFPFCEQDIPRNGIYILFEDGEQAHGTRRIVRIGTHTGNNQLRSRLKQHFVNQIKDRSIFRKNIGRCLLNRENDPFLPTWELDLTTNAAKKQYAGKIDLKSQQEIEGMVSAYMQNHLRFVVIEVPEKERRLELESRITSTVSLCPDCGPSKGWLGLHSPKQKICKCGLWQVNELYKQPFSADELQAFTAFTHVASDNKA
ncbi:MAG: DUF6884 domain-containing protein [Pirellulaceae bacterium]